METNHSFPTFFDFTNSLLETENRLPSDSTAASLDTHNTGIFAYSTTSLDDDVKQSLLSLEESEYEPTCVLLFKKVPFEAQETDILKICHPFGVISDIYLMKAKNYALIQFKELNSAMTCFETYRNFEPKIKGQSVFVFYTGKKTIYKTESNGTLPSRYLLFSLNTEDEVVTNVLVASMLSPYGKILQIQLVQSTPVLAYVEMEDIGAAISAREDTNDKIYAESIHIQSTYINQKLFEHYIQLCSEYKPTPQSMKSFNNLQKSSPQFHFQPKSETTFEKYESPIDLLQNEKEKAKSMSTIMVKNLPKGVSLMNLFRLFGCYGNVMKIKIFFSNPENCLIEYQDNTQALLAKTHLNNCPFRGNTLYVVQSKNPIIINTPYIPETNKFLADFSESKEHRYRIAGSKNFRNIARPSAVLHLSNICEDKDDSFYHHLFKECGKIRRSYPLKGEGKGLLVEMDDVAQAVEVLINYHNYNIEGKFLKVSFSKYQKIKD